MIYKNITPYRNENSASYPSVPSNTLRFMFSKSDYDPTEAGVGSSGTWAKKTEFPNANVWDWTNTNTDWSVAFEGAFPDAENEVRVIAAGDTSSVTKMSALFAGVFTGAVQNATYSLTARNNILSCVPFDISGTDDIRRMFIGTALKKVVRFDYSNGNSNLQAQGLFADSLVKDFDELEIGAKLVFTMFSRCYNLIHVGKIKFDSTKLRTTTNDWAALFTMPIDAPTLNIETIEGIEGLGNITNGSGLFTRLRKLKKIGGSLDCSSMTDLTTIFQSCESLEELPILENLGSANVTTAYVAFSGCYKLKSAPMFDTSHITDARNMFVNCRAFTEIPDYDFSSVTKVGSFCRGCENVSSGIIETYNKFLDRGDSITDHSRTFENCGINTPEGQIALSQIPASWGGTGT